jgi:hypothetical protein
MGHLRLGQLPRTRKWNEVVELIKQNGDAAFIAAAALEAADKGFGEAAEDEGLGRATWLLTQLPLAARDPEFQGRLASLGIEVENAPGLFDLVGAFTDAVDAQMRRSGGRTDFGEMAQMAAAETLTAILGERTQNFFGSSPAELQRELAALGTKKQFGTLARDFFSRLTRRFLTFFLSRELSNHVGGDRRFANTSEHVAFNRALERHCKEASRIVEDFAGSWFSKTNWQKGITPEGARGFAWVALNKLRSELRKGGTPR